MTRAIELPTDSRFIDLTGKRFGRYVVLAYLGKRTNSNHSRWLCVCDCGATRNVGGEMLRKGRSLSCGCLARERSATRMTKHGMRFSAEHRVWRSILSRCHNPHATGYDRYGGAGVVVCDEWRGHDGFSRFFRDMGVRPRGATIDRLDNSKGYSKDNCRWATRKQQSNNRRNTVFIELLGRRLSASEWADETGLPRHLIARRFRHGWSPEEILTTPVGARTRWTKR